MTDAEIARINELAKKSKDLPKQRKDSEEGGI